MRKLDPGRSILFFWSDLTYHEAALLADDDAKHLAPRVTNALDDFNTILKLDLDSQRAVLQANARAEVADVHLDERIRKLHSAALFLVNQVRKQPEFKSLFSETIDKVVRYALKRQVEEAEKLVETLGLKLYSEEFRASHSGPLQALVAAGRTILGEVRSAQIARTDARLEIRAWKDDVNALRLANYGELLAIAARTDRSRDWTETFFKKTQASETDESEDVDDATKE